MITFIDSLLALFDFIQTTLLSPKYYGLGEANKVVKYDLADRMQLAKKHHKLLINVRWLE